MLSKDERRKYYEQNKERWCLYYIKNKEKLKAYSKANYKGYNKANNTANTQKQEYYKTYYQKHKEKIQQTSRTYYNKYKDKISQNAKIYYQNNKGYNKDYYYYKRLPEELQELIDIEDVKRDRKPKIFKKTIKTVLNEKVLEFIPGKKTILFE